MREIQDEYLMNYLHWRGQNPERSMDNFNKMIGMLKQNIAIPAIKKVLKASN